MSTYQSRVARMYKAIVVSAVMFSASLFAVQPLNGGSTMQMERPDNANMINSGMESKQVDVRSDAMTTPQPAVTDVHVQKPASGMQDTKAVDKSGVTSQAAVVVDLSQNYVNKDKGYSIVFPKNWEMKEKFMGLDVFALSPLEGDKDAFRENVNIITEDLSNPMSLDEYYSMGLVNLKTLLADFKEIDSGTIDVNGIPMKWIVYDHRMGEVRARVLQFIAVKDRRAFVITFSAMPDDFAKYRPAFEQIGKTFKFNGGVAPAGDVNANKEVSAPAAVK